MKNLTLGIFINREDAERAINKLHEELGIQLVVVDPLGEEVVAFYERFGFQEFSGGRLLLSLKTVKRALAE